MTEPPSPEPASPMAGAASARDRLASLIFAGLIYAIMGVMGLAGAPFVLWREDWTRRWAKLWCRTVFRLIHWMFGIGIRVESADGSGIPDGDVLIAAKHQSMLDVLILYATLPRARFAMKRELMWMPVFGLYARRTGAVPIDRRPHHGAMETLNASFDVASGGVPGQIVIYPQGTRVAPGVKAPYRYGVVRLAEAMGRPVVPAATNAGLFWSRGGRISGPGTAVVRFGPPIAQEPTRDRSMAAIKSWIEDESRNLTAGSGATEAVGSERF